MDRPTSRKEADPRGSRPDPIEAFVLPSRRLALDLCLDRKCIGSGPILVTGESGVGKTWLWRRLAAEMDPARRWIGVDLTPANEPADFYRLIAHELGLTEPGPTSASRIDLVEYLADRHAEGERAVLVVDEAHNLSVAVWEEVRVLANRLDRPGGFSAILLVGQTPLARRLTTRPFAAIEARLSAKVHLGPIDADEAGEWVAHLRPDREWPAVEVEALHREAFGNPRRMLRKIGGDRGMIAVRPAKLELDQAFRSKERPEVAVPVSPPVPLTGPDRPPIRVEENMIEVGWSPEDGASPGEMDGEQAQTVGTLPPGEESVKDHYAALQAWREWTENQGRRASAAVRPPDPRHDPDHDDLVEDEERSSPLADRPTVRAEGEQPFAPFGQLFSRMAQAREPE